MTLKGTAEVSASLAEFISRFKKKEEARTIAGGEEIRAYLATILSTIDWPDTALLRRVFELKRRIRIACEGVTFADTSEIKNLINKVLTPFAQTFSLVMSTDGEYLPALILTIGEKSEQHILVVDSQGWVGKIDQRAEELARETTITPDTVKKILFHHPECVERAIMRVIEIDNDQVLKALDDIESFISALEKVKASQAVIAK